MQDGGKLLEAPQQSVADEVQIPFTMKKKTVPEPKAVMLVFAYDSGTYMIRITEHEQEKVIRLIRDGRTTGGKTLQHRPVAVWPAEDAGEALSLIGDLSQSTLTENADLVARAKKIMEV
jgi:hypothetical protein